MIKQLFERKHDQNQRSLANFIFLSFIIFCRDSTWCFLVFHGFSSYFLCFFNCALEFFFCLAHFSIGSFLFFLMVLKKKTPAFFKYSLAPLFFSLVLFPFLCSSSILQWFCSAQARKIQNVIEK